MSILRRYGLRKVLLLGFRSRKAVLIRFQMSLDTVSRRNFKIDGTTGVDLRVGSGNLKGISRLPWKCRSVVKTLFFRGVY